ncbi:MAG: GNAT family N-acetyltransferase [Lautropia sp.]
MTIRNLHHLLRPTSVAVIGASDRAGSLGSVVWRNVIRAGFGGRAMPVNPKHTKLGSAEVFPDVHSLPVAPDLAIICTPARTVPALIRQLGQRGTRAVIIVSANLSTKQIRAVLEAARPHLLRVLGPNCIGVQSPVLHLDATFAHALALPGRLAFLTQSGALATAMLDWSRGKGIGFSHVVSLGEQSDVDFGDLLDYLASDEGTDAILLYVESVKSARKFMSAARAAARNKPVFVVKAGRSACGARAVGSHTGALAGSDAVYDAAIRRAGMLRVDTLQDLFSAAQTIAKLGRHVDDNLTIVTNGGGAGVLAADAADAAGVRLTDLPAGTIVALDRVLPPGWSRSNPIDLIGDAPVERYVRTLSELLARPENGALLLIHAPTAIVDSAAIARACLPVVQPAAHRVLSVWLGDAAVAAARTQFEAAGIPTYETPEEAVQAFRLLQSYRSNQQQLMEVPPAAPPCTPDLERARNAIRAALAAGRTWLSQIETLDVLAAYGIPTAPAELVAATPDAAAEAASRLGYPVALKVESPDVLHKTDVGGVHLGLRDEAGLRQAVRAVLDRIGVTRPDIRIAGLLVQRMIERPHARETILGASIDPAFGPVVLFGQGGVAVELLRDTVIALPPLNRALARQMIDRTRISKLLEPYRNRPGARHEAVEDALTAVSRMLSDLPELAELDVNPLLADENGVIALDARIRIAAAPVGGKARFAILPYPSEWIRSGMLDGRPITLRPIRPEDGPQHRQFLERIEPEDLRKRFFLTQRTFSRSQLARLTQIDYDREIAFVAEFGDGAGAAETVGVGRTVSDPDREIAEFALLVRSDLKGKGLGRTLLRLLIEHAEAGGVGRLAGYILRENAAMLRLAISEGFRIVESPATSRSEVYVEKVLGSRAPSVPVGQPARAEAIGHVPASTLPTERSERGQ